MNSVNNKLVLCFGTLFFMMVLIKFLHNKEQPYIKMQKIITKKKINHFLFIN